MDARTTRTRWAGLVSMRALLGLVMMLGVLSMQAGRGTLAYFTSTATSTANTFTAGTVTLQVADGDQSASSAITASIDASTLKKPGDTAVGWVTVSNAGTLPFDYGLKYTATNGTPALWAAGSPPTLQVYTGAVGSCTHANVIGAKTGLTSAYSATAVAPPPATNTVVFDSGAASKRPIANGASETLCFAVNWPLSATAGAENAQQGGSGTIDFTFDARQ